jgi:regulatory protein
VILAVLDRLQESDLQDDGRFAAQFAQAAIARGLAGRRIQSELRARGVGKDLAAEASVEDQDEELARERELAGRRASRMEDVPREAVLRRITGLLARRGFDPETCRQVASEVVRSPVLDPAVPPDLP